MGKPADAENYSKLESNGIGVYVRNDVQTANDEVKVNYVKFLFKEGLAVEGLVY